jgi:hypothetical protein
MRSESKGGGGVTWLAWLALLGRGMRGACGALRSARSRRGGYRASRVRVRVRGACACACACTCSYARSTRSDGARRGAARVAHRAPRRPAPPRAAPRTARARRAPSLRVDRAMRILCRATPRAAHPARSKIIINYSRCPIYILISLLSTYGHPVSLFYGQLGETAVSGYTLFYAHPIRVARRASEACGRVGAT